VRLIDNERAFFSDRKSFHFPSGMAADGVVTPSALSVNSTAKASDDSHLYVGHGTDDAPRIQLVFVAHKDSLRSHFRDRTFGFCRHDTRPEQALTVQRRTAIYQKPAGWWFSDNLCKTLSKGQAF